MPAACTTCLLSVWPPSGCDKVTEAALAGCLSHSSAHAAAMSLDLSASAAVVVARPAAWSISWTMPVRGRGDGVPAAGHGAASVLFLRSCSFVKLCLQLLPHRDLQWAGNDMTAMLPARGQPVVGNASCHRKDEHALQQQGVESAPTRCRIRLLVRVARTVQLDVVLASTVQASSHGLLVHELLTVWLL
jgi:hypothetical protein